MNSQFYKSELSKDCLVKGLKIKVYFKHSSGSSKIKEYYLKSN